MADSGRERGFTVPVKVPTNYVYMKPVCAILLVLLAAASARAELTNLIYVADRSSGGQFSQFDCEVDGFADTRFVFVFNEVVTNVGFSFKMSYYPTRTNRETVYVNDSITTESNRASFLMRTTNIPQSSIYLGELYGVQNNYEYPWARGRVNVTRSLFDNFPDNVNLTSITNISISDSTGTYTRLIRVNFDDNSGLHASLIAPGVGNVALDKTLFLASTGGSLPYLEFDGGGRFEHDGTNLALTGAALSGTFVGDGEGLTNLVTGVNWSEYPATQTVDIAGNVITNAIYYGDGAGLTNMITGANWSQFPATQTVNFAGNIVTGGIYYGDASGLTGSYNKITANQYDLNTAIAGMPAELTFLRNDAGDYGLLKLGGTLPGYPHTFLTDYNYNDYITNIADMVTLDHLTNYYTIFQTTALLVDYASRAWVSENYLSDLEATNYLSMTWANDHLAVIQPDGYIDDSLIDPALHTLTNYFTKDQSDVRYPVLDGASKIPADYLYEVFGDLLYQGTFDATSSNTPSIASNGWYWIVDTAGTITNVDPNISLTVGDYLIYSDETSWGAISRPGVLSVAGQVGHVTGVDASFITSGEFSASQIDEADPIYVARLDTNHVDYLLTKSRGLALFTENAITEETDPIYRADVISGAILTRTAADSMYVNTSSDPWNFHNKTATNVGAMYFTAGSQIVPASTNAVNTNDVVIDGAGNIDVPGVLTAAGADVSGDVDADGDIAAVGAMSGASLAISGNGVFGGAITGASLMVSGNISSGGGVSCTQVVSSGSVSGSTLSANGDIVAGGNVDVVGSISGESVSAGTITGLSSALFQGMPGGIGSNAVLSGTCLQVKLERENIGGPSFINGWFDIVGTNDLRAYFGEEDQTTSKIELTADNINGTAGDITLTAGSEYELSAPVCDNEFVSYYRIYSPSPSGIITMDCAGDIRMSSASMSITSGNAVVISGATGIELNGDVTINGTAFVPGSVNATNEQDLVFQAWRTGTYNFAQSTTNYAVRTTWAATNSGLQAQINTKLGTSLWASADSTTNYASRAAYNTATGALWTAVNGKLDVSGGTATGPLYTTQDSGYEANEIPAAGWVRDVAANGKPFYLSSNEVMTTKRELNEVLPVLNFSITKSVSAEGEEIASFITPSKVLSASGPVSFSVYLSRAIGAGSPSVQVNAEFGYSYDGTNVIGNWTDGNQSLSTTTNEYKFMASFGEMSFTNGGAYIVGTLKTGPVTGSANSVKLSGGYDYPSRMLLNVPTVSDLNAMYLQGSPIFIDTANTQIIFTVGGVTWTNAP